MEKSPNVYKSYSEMISVEKWKILTHLQKLPKNVGDLGKIIVAIGFEKFPKVQSIAQSGHTVCECNFNLNQNRQLVVVGFLVENNSAPIAHFLLHPHLRHLQDSFLLLANVERRTRTLLWRRSSCWCVRTHFLRTSVARHLTHTWHRWSVNVSFWKCSAMANDKF